MLSCKNFKDCCEGVRKDELLFGSDPSTAEHSIITRTRYSYLEVAVAAVMEVMMASGDSGSIGSGSG